MNKNQQKNRMGAVIILLAAACLNGYAQPVGGIKLAHI